MKSIAPFMANNTNALRYSFLRYKVSASCLN